MSRADHLDARARKRQQQAAAATGQLQRGAARGLGQGLPEREGAAPPLHLITVVDLRAPFGIVELNRLLHRSLAPFFTAANASAIGMPTILYLTLPTQMK